MCIRLGTWRIVGYSGRRWRVGSDWRIEIDREKRREEGKRQFGKLRTTVDKVEASVLEPLDERARESLHKLLLTLFEHNVKPAD